MNGLLLAVALFSSGCAMTGFSGKIVDGVSVRNSWAAWSQMVLGSADFDAASISRDGGSRQILRSQDEAPGESRGGEPSVESPGKTQPPPSWFRDAEADRSAEITGSFEVSDTPPFTAVSGHSFHRPKARLGRPVPLPKSSQEAASPALENSTPPRIGYSANLPASSNQQTPGSDMHEPFPFRNREAVPSEVNEPRRFFDDPSWKKLADSFAESSTEASERMNSRAEQVQSAAELPAEIAESGQTEIGASQSQADPPPGIDMKESEDPDATEAARSQQPTVLNRLKGFYPPILDDNTDRLRRQMRRWPDPFGLLRERPEGDVADQNELPREATSENSQFSTGSWNDAAATQPESTASPLYSVISDLERELAAWPQGLSGTPERIADWRKRQTDLRLLYMIDGRSAESIKAIVALPQEEQEFWQSLMLAMNRYRSCSGDPFCTPELTDTVEYLRTAAKKLQPLATLQLRRLMFCDGISGFGAVSAYPASVFAPGQRILIYGELENVQSELTAEGKYRSEFAAVIDFMRIGDDEILETIRIPQIVDECDVQRTDYFQSFELTVPALEGDYLLRVRVRDQLSLQTAESRLEFSVRPRKAAL